MSADLQNATLTIYNFARGARGVRVIWLCEEMGLSWRLSQVSFPPPPEYRARNPLGTVPFLEDGEVAIAESVAMLLYLVQRYGPTPLYPAPGDLARVLELCVFSEASLGAHLNTLMEAHFAAPEAEKQNWSVRAQQARLARDLELLVRRLGESPYLAGEAFSLADIAVAPALGMWRGALGGVLPAPLSAYMDRLGERPAYQRARATQG